MTTQKTASNVTISGNPEWAVDSADSNVRFKSVRISTRGVDVETLNPTRPLGEWKSENDFNVVAVIRVSPVTGMDEANLDTYKLTVTTNNGDSGKTTHHNSPRELDKAFKAAVTAIEFTMDQMLDR
tara:strand:- start:892 stop:1269 length:378 start_codon:yes stop_codon:yes gene_type:complete